MSKGKSKPKKVGRPKQPKVPCVIPGCKRSAVAKRLCHTHYRKAAREGLTAKIQKGDKRALAKMTEDGRATRWLKR